MKPRWMWTCWRKLAKKLWLTLWTRSAITTSSEIHQKLNLGQVNGTKTLVLDASLAGPLGLVTEVALLKVLFGPLSLRFVLTARYYMQHHGVDKMFWLEPGPLTSTTSNIIYLCRPLIKYVKIIAGMLIPCRIVPYWSFSQIKSSGTRRSLKSTHIHYFSYHGYLHLYLEY